MKKISWKRSLEKGLVKKLSSKRTLEKGLLKNVSWKRSLGKGLLKKVSWKRSPEKCPLCLLWRQMWRQCRFCEDVRSKITGLEFIRGFRGFSGFSGFSGFRRNGVRSCSSDPPKHAQESQDDVSSQQTPQNHPKVCPHLMQINLP